MAPPLEIQLAKSWLITTVVAVAGTATGRKPKANTGSRKGPDADNLV